MPVQAYATRDDVFNLALSAKAFVVRAQPFDGIDVATGIVRLKAHGLSGDDFVTLEVTSGGSLPVPITGFDALTAFTKYAVESVEFDYFRLIDVGTGNPITGYDAAGAGWSVAVDLMRRLDRHREAAAARIDESLTAHAPPLAVPYPIQVVEINARLAARRMLTTLQFDNAAFRVAAEELRATAEQDEQQLRMWVSGKPVHPRPTDETPTIADNAARAKAGRAPAGWTTGCL
jgi:hypothetical protein